MSHKPQAPSLDTGSWIMQDEVMKEIIYKGKKVKVPFEDANYTLDGEKDVVLKNRFGGENAQCRAMLQPFTM